MTFRCCLDKQLNCEMCDSLMCDLVGSFLLVLVSPEILS